MVNKVTLIGNVGKDPEVKVLPSGSSVANFSLATTRKWNDKEGNKNEETEWHNLCVFGKGADVIEKYVSKGSKLYVDGRIRTRKWEDKEGNNRYTTEIMVDNFQMLDSPPGGKTNSKPAAAAPDSDDDVPF